MARGDLRGPRRHIRRVLDLEHRSSDNTGLCGRGCGVHECKPSWLVCHAHLPLGAGASGPWAGPRYAANRDHCAAQRERQGGSIASRTKRCSFGNIGPLRRRRMRRALVAIERKVEPRRDDVGVRAESRERRKPFIARARRVCRYGVVVTFGLRAVLGAWGGFFGIVE